MDFVMLKDERGLAIVVRKCRIRMVYMSMGVTYMKLDGEDMPIALYDSVQEVMAKLNTQEGH